MKSLCRVPFFLRPDNNIGSYYLLDNRSPLQVYMTEHWAKDSSTKYSDRWGLTAKLYANYGHYLIEKHPALFIKYYLWPNLAKYYVPSIGSLGTYNEGKDTVTPIEVRWFGWKNNKALAYFENREISIAAYFQLATAFITLIFLLSIISFIGLGGLKSWSSYGKRALRWLIIVWIGNMMVGIWTAPIELSHQIFPMIVNISFIFVFASSLIQQYRLENTDLQQKRNYQLL